MESYDVAGEIYLALPNLEAAPLVGIPFITTGPPPRVKVKYFLPRHPPRFRPASDRHFLTRRATDTASHDVTNNRGFQTLIS